MYFAAGTHNSQPAANVSDAEKNAMNGAVLFAEAMESTETVFS